MIYNDTLRRLRYTFDFSDSQMISIFHAVGHEVSREQVSDWLKQDEDPAFQECTGEELAIFLNGLIVKKRGKSDGPAMVPEKKMTNNIIFRKLKIALELKAEDIIDLMNLADLKISKHELSAFFRKADHKNYRECKDQILRYFLKGLQLKHRP